MAIPQYPCWGEIPWIERLVALWGPWGPKGCKELDMAEQPSTHPAMENLNYPPTCCICFEDTLANVYSSPGRVNNTR